MLSSDDQNLMNLCTEILRGARDPRVIDLCTEIVRRIAIRTLPPKPRSKDRHREYMRGYMKKWRKGEVGLKHMFEREP